MVALLLPQAEGRQLLYRKKFDKADLMKSSFYWPDFLPAVFHYPWNLRILQINRK